MRLAGTPSVCGTSRADDGRSLDGILGGSWALSNSDVVTDDENRKSVLIDSRFGPAWLAFAHSYALEGEHDQAITAYSTALRHSQGSHLPLLFIGMQQLGLMNLTLAEEYLNTAKNICNEDPLATNELGVVAVHNDRCVQSLS